MGQNVRSQVLITWIFVLIMFSIFRFYPDKMLIVYLLNLWLFNFPHTIATYFVPKTRERFSSRELFLIFSVFLIITVGIHLMWGKVIVIALYFYWQFFHYARQNYGLMKLNLTEDKHFLLSQMTYVFPLLSLGYLFAKGSISFLGYSLPILAIKIPAHYFIYAYFLSAVIYLYKSSKLSKNIFILSVSHVSIFSLTYLLFDNINLAWPLMNVQHCLMYIFVVNEVSFKNIKKSYPIFVLSSLCIYVPMHILGYVPTKLSIWVDITAFIMLVFTLSHYYIDGFIWRGKLK